MDPADDLYCLANSFVEVDFRTTLGNEDGCADEFEKVGLESATSYLDKTHVKVYLTEALSILAEKIGNSGEDTSKSRNGSNSNNGAHVISTSAGSSRSNGSNRSNKILGKNMRPMSAKARLNAGSKGKSRSKKRVDSDMEQGSAFSEDGEVGESDLEEQTEEDRLNGVLLSNDGFVKDKDPLRFLYSYFSKVARGDHVASSRFAFIIATDWNRVCFGRLLKKSLGHLERDRNISFQDFVQMVRVFCEDFSSDLIRVCFFLVHTKTLQKKFTASSEFDPAVSTVPFGMMLRVTCIWLVYDEFLKLIINEVLQPNMPKPDGSFWDVEVSQDQVENGINSAYASTKVNTPPKYLLDEAITKMKSNSPRLLTVRHVLTTIIMGDMCGLSEHTKL